MPALLLLLLVLPLPALAADVSPADPSSYQSVGWLLMGLFALVGMYNQGVAAMLNTRKLRAPGPEETETEAKFAAVAKDIRELEMRVEKRMAETMGSINTRLGTLESSISRAISDINYAIGKIDGQTGN